MPGDQTYSLACDNCGEIFQSQEAFPPLQLCPKCKAVPSDEELASPERRMMEAKQNKRLPKELAKSASALAKVLNEHDERLIKETHETTLKEVGEWLDSKPHLCTIEAKCFVCELIKALKQRKMPE